MDSSKQHPIIHHNDSITTAYRFWSPSYNIHFGYWEWGINPLNREAMLEALNEQVLKALDLRQGDRIKLLDAGCGTGATLRYLARKMPAAELHGISLAQELTELGRQLNASSPAIQLHCGDFQDMPFPDGSFDAIVAMESVCYGAGSDKAALAGEFARVLKEQGVLVVVDVFRKKKGKLPWPFTKLLKTIEKNWAIQDTGILPSFIALLEDNGFKINTIRNISLNTLPSVAHIPWVVFRLVLSSILRNDDNRKGKLTYAKALSTTLLTGLLTPFMGYYLIRATKEGFQGDK